MEIVGVTSRYSPAMIFNKLRIDVDDIPSRELAYPTLGKESHLQTCLGMGYVSSQEDISQMRTMTLEKKSNPSFILSEIFPGVSLLLWLCMVLLCQLFDSFRGDLRHLQYVCVLKFVDFAFLAAFKCLWHLVGFIAETLI